MTKTIKVSFRYGFMIAIEESDDEEYNYRVFVLDKNGDLFQDFYGVTLEVAEEVFEEFFNSALRWCETGA